MKKKIKGILLASAVVLGMNGCESVKQIKLPDGQIGEEYSMMLVADTRNGLSRYIKMHDYGFRMRPSLINIPGNKTITLKVEAYTMKGGNYKVALTPGSGGLKPTLMTNIPEQNSGTFSLYPMILNGVKPLSCKTGNKQGYTTKYLECKYNKQTLIKSIGKLDGPVGKQWEINGFLVDETNDGTSSDAWKCSQPYIPELFAAKNSSQRLAVKEKQRLCIASKYGISLYRNPLGLLEDVNDKVNYNQVMFGKKHYRFAVKNNKEILKFLSK